MSFDETGGAASRPSINVTPLIDVLLVLLIIFMVIQPTAVHGLPSLVPKPSRPSSALEQEPILLQLSRNVSGETTFRVNTRSVPSRDLATQLHGLIERRSDSVLYIRGNADLEYGAVLSAMDAARNAGFRETAILTGTPATGI